MATVRRVALLAHSPTHPLECTDCSGRSPTTWIPSCPRRTPACARPGDELQCGRPPSGVSPTRLALALRGKRARSNQTGRLSPVLLVSGSGNADVSTATTRRLLECPVYEPDGSKAVSNDDGLQPGYRLTPPQNTRLHQPWRRASMRKTAVWPFTDPENEVTDVSTETTHADVPVRHLLLCCRLVIVLAQDAPSRLPPSFEHEPLAPFCACWLYPTSTISSGMGVRLRFVKARMSRRLSVSMICTTFIRRPTEEDVPLRLFPVASASFRLVKKDTPRRAYPSYELQSRDDRGIAVAPLLRRVCGLRVGLRTSDARPSRVGATRLASSPPWLPVYSLLVRCLRAFPLHTWPAASPGSRRRRRRLLCTVALDDCPFAHHWPSTLWAGRLRTIRPVSVVPLLHGPSRYWSRVPVSKLRRPQLSSATFRVRLASIHVTAVEGLTSRPRPTTSTVTRPKLSASLVHTLDVVALVESTSTSTSLCSTTSRMLSAGSAAWPGGKRLGAALAQGRQRPTIRGWLASSGLRGGEVMAALLRGLFRQPYAARHAFLSSRGASPPQAGSSETEVSRNSVIHVCTAASQHLPPSLMASLPLPLLLPTPSYTSLSSHWSDSTPLGATISLHTLAKPLMRLQYHREVQQLITRHHGAVLIEESMEVLVTYLRYKYVGPVTKKLILEELSLRAAIGDAQIITDVLFSLPDLLSELLSTSAGRYRKNLGTQKLPDDFLCEVTLELLGKLARSLSGSSAIISSGVLCHVPALLNSSSTVWQLTCQLLASLHSHFCHRHGSDSTDARIPSEALLALVHAAEYGPLNQCHLAWSALVPIARWECSALAMVNAGVWNVAAHSLHWFEPSSGEIYLQKHFPPSDLELKVANYACRVISGLLEHHSAIPSGTLDFIPPAHLGFWITQPGMQVSADAVFNHYSFEEMTPKAILGNYFECLSILLSSRVDSAPEKLQYICGVLGALTASHKSIAAALLQLPADPIRFLIWCLSHPHVQKQAITTLTTFASYPEGHQHTVKIFTKMEAVAILVASEDHAIQNWVLAMHEEAMPEKKKKKKKTTDSRYLQIPAWITAQ
uniref:Uncharacterized protein n=1 Tax=Mycena chlorophos TaxID=658473 RepID=A0ABQ0L525_MYCCL|nr:predicted protein [Mycena chlorophos]